MDPQACAPIRTNLDASSKLTGLLIHNLFNLEASCRGERMGGRFQSGVGDSN